MLRTEGNSEQGRTNDALKKERTVNAFSNSTSCAYSWDWLECDQAVVGGEVFCFFHLKCECGLDMAHNGDCRDEAVHEEKKAKSLTDELADLRIEQAEHRSFNECIQFEGDTCDSCTAFAAQIDALVSAINTDVALNGADQNGAGFGWDADLDDFPF